MDAVEYVKALRRLCNSQDCYFGRIPGCPLLNKEDKKDGYCIANISEYAEKSVQIVEQWAKDHPVKTRQSEFLKMFPDAIIKNGIIAIWPQNICESYTPEDGCTYTACGLCRKRFWLTEVTDND